MPLAFAGDDATKALLDLAEENLRALEWFSGYLNLCPRFVSGEDVEALTRECGVTEEEAYRLLMASACGLDIAGDLWARKMAERYFRPGVHRLDAAACRADPYYASVRLPQARQGEWTLGYKRIEAYEAFVSADMLLLPDGREVPQAGYFNEPFEAPVVTQNGREWMTVTPNEIATMEEAVRRANGHVVAMGLGLGYFAFRASEKPEVARVTVVERDPDVIALFQEELLPQFPNREKITVVQDDAFTFAEKRLPDFGADFVFVDLWHDTADGAEMYLRMKKFERRTGAPFAYWIEPSVVALIRGLAHDDAETGRAWAERLLKSGARVEDAAADWLTFDMIR